MRGVYKAYRPDDRIRQRLVSSDPQEVYTVDSAILRGAVYVERDGEFAIILPGTRGSPGVALRLSPEIRRELYEVLSDIEWRLDRQRE